MCRAWCVVHRARRGGSRRAGGGEDDGCLVSPWVLLWVSLLSVQLRSWSVFFLGFGPFGTLSRYPRSSPLHHLPQPLNQSFTLLLVYSPHLSRIPSHLIISLAICPARSHRTYRLESLSTSTLVLHSVIASPPSHPRIPASLSLLHLSYTSSRLSLSSCVTTITESQLAKQL